MQKLRIILYDLETSPIISYNWGLWEQNALAVIKDWELLSFSYKVLGEKKIVCVSRPQFKDKTDRAITKALWQVLNSADVCVAHNGLSYDSKKSNAKFLQHGLTPPKPSVMIDTLRVARKHFKLSSNKLNDLGKLLGVGQKAHTGGFKLWQDCMRGVREAWRTMIKYNKKDVELLEKVYLRLLPWISNHPRITEQLDGCPKCGHTKLQSRGIAHTKTQSYYRYVCLKCHGWCRSAKKIAKSKSAYIVNL